MEKQLLNRINALEKNVVNLYKVQGTGTPSVSVIGVNSLNTIYSLIPFSNSSETNVDNIILGNGAGTAAEEIAGCVILGTGTGTQSSGSYSSVFIGAQSGSISIVNNAVFIGNGAGIGVTNGDFSNFIGQNAGYTASSVYNSNFFGEIAGTNSAGTHNCNFFGREAGAYSIGNNVNAFGNGAGFINKLSGQTIFSNSSLPSFVNRVEALAAITSTLGSAGSTYLYYNATTHAIEAVRL